MVDAATDRHPAFLRSKSHIQGPLRRFAGIVVDVYYDHLLTREWRRFRDVPLERWIEGFHDAVRSHAKKLPPAVAADFFRLTDEGLLVSYGSLDGVAAALRRIGRRLRRPVDLSAALPQLAAADPQVREDFLELHPHLVELLARHRRGDAG